MRVALKPILFALPLLALRANAVPPEEAARRLAERVAPTLVGRLAFETIPSAGGNDVFEIESVGGKVVLRGDNGVALASALNRYLEEFCHSQISWDCGGRISVPNPAPTVPRRIRVVCPYRLRYAYNYCTHGYTMAWWSWPQWERELDFLALKGVNLALVIEGQEQVWIEALGKFGYTGAEVRQWLCLPGHQPWQYMGNMEGYGGPLSPGLVDRRAALGRKIVARMAELGIEPVLQGYYGIVPSDFKDRFPRARVHPQGGWNGLKRPDLLDPLDPRFARLAAAFYRAQDALYGREARFLAADPFHEGGSTAGIDLAACGRAIYGAMAAGDPGAVWVLQSWEENPRLPMIDALDKSKLLVLDLDCEAQEHWRTRNQFDHTPWLWCTISNFGGNVGLSDNLEALRLGPARALAEAGPGRGQMEGIGAAMEGTGTQPLVWEMFFANTWRSRAVDLGPWLRDYGRRRYGRVSEPAERALRILVDTVYTPAATGEPVNSVICARPSLDPYPKADHWGTTKPFYDPARLVEAWRLLLAAAPECGESDGYRYDVADLGRQVLVDLFGRYHREILRAYARKDAAELARRESRALGLIGDLDALLATRREFLLGAWLRDARACGATPGEKDQCERDARELLTVWVRPDTDALDYANRQWSGLIGTFYRARWETWFGSLRASLASGRPLDPAAVAGRIRAGDLDWTRRHDPYPAEPSGDTLAVAQRLFAKYAAEALSPDGLR